MSTNFFYPGDMVQELEYAAHVGRITLVDFTVAAANLPYCVARWNDGCSGMYLTAREIKLRED